MMFPKLESLFRIVNIAPDFLAVIRDIIEETEMKDLMGELLLRLAFRIF